MGLQDFRSKGLEPYFVKIAVMLGIDGRRSVGASHGMWRR